MLTKIRDRATGWIAWIIVFLISIPFALWGVNEYFAGGTEINVAEVNGVEIDQQAYRTALDDQREALARALGGRTDPELVNSLSFRRGVLDGLIQRTLLLNDAVENGYRVSDEQLRRFIQTAPQFQRDGTFDAELYRQTVESYRYTPTGFEERLRQENMLEQVRSGFAESTFITSKDMDALLKAFQQKRTFQYVSIDPEKFRDSVAIPDSEIEEEYTKNSESYQVPEQMRVQYVRLAVDDLKKEVSVDESQVRALYENNPQRFITPQRRKASHILIQATEEDGEDRIAEAREKIETLRQQIAEGADFAEFAKEHSEDPGSAAQGGDLGFVEKGAMVEPFEAALYKLSEGEVSDPVRTQFGFHLIKLTEWIPEAQKPFAELRDELEKEEIRRQAEDLFLDRAETFRNLVYEHPESLEVASEELKLPLMVSEWFARDEGVAGDVSENPKVRQAAFSGEVYDEGLNSETLETDRDTLIALRKLELKPESIKPLAEVRDDIEQKLVSEKTRERAHSEGEEMLKTLNDGGKWSEATSARELDSHEITVTRADNQSEVSLEVVQDVFKAGYPGAEQPIFGGVALNAGPFVVYRLEKVEEGDPAVANDALRERVKTALQSRWGQDAFLAYMHELREGADITVFEDQL